MKLLLTSGGISNDSISNALKAMLAKPISQCHALCIPTASYALKNGVVNAWNFLRGYDEAPMCNLGWKSMGVLELTALPSLDQDLWLPALKQADILLVNGGDPLYLSYWMRKSGVADLLPDLDLVYVGMSAGSMIMAPRIGDDFVMWTKEGLTDKTLGYVDFAIFPHLNHVLLPENTKEQAISWAHSIQIPGYAIDDQTAIQVIDNTVSVISEGEWYSFDYTKESRG